MNVSAMSVDAGEGAVMGVYTCAPSPGGLQPVLHAAAPAFVPGTTRILAARTPRERSPRRPSPPMASSPSAPGDPATGTPSRHFLPGQAVRPGGLESRPELAGPAVVVSLDPTTARYAVQVGTNGEKIKVKASNLSAQPSSTG